MNFTQFTKKVVNLFQSRKDAKRINSRITRGRAIDCSSEIEELLAITISQFIPEKYSILIDYPLSIKTNKRTTVIYPDLSIIEGNTLKGIVEIKIDLGYLKGNWIKESNVIYESILKSKSVSYNKNVGLPNKERVILNITSNVKRSVIVLTGKNDHGRLNNFVTKQSDCFVLLKDHPNSEKISKPELNKFIKEMYKNDSNWKKMELYFKKNFK